VYHLDNKMVILAFCIIADDIIDIVGNTNASNLTKLVYMYVYAFTHPKRNKLVPFSCST